MSTLAIKMQILSHPVHTWAANLDEQARELFHYAALAIAGEY